MKTISNQWALSFALFTFFSVAGVEGAAWAQASAPAMPETSATEVKSNTDSGRLSVKKVFAKDLGSPVRWLTKGGLLDTESGPISISPDGERILVSDMLVYRGRPRLRWIEWRKHKDVSRVYKDISCDPALPHLGAIFTDLTFVPQNNEIVAIACHRLYLLDSSTLEVKKVLLGGQVTGPIALSLDGSTLLVQGTPTKEPSAVRDSEQVIALATSTWTVGEGWKIPGKLAGLGITADGMSGVLLVHETDNDAAKCVLWIQDLPFSSSQARDLQTGHPCGPTFYRRVLPAVPNEPNSIIQLGSLLQVWDIRKRALVRKQELQLPDMGINEMNDFALRVSPDGNYVAFVLNSNLFFQELRVIDTHTGKLVYESAKDNYSQALRGIGMVRTTAFEGVSSGISANSQYVLIARGKRVAIYEVTGH